MNTLEWANKYAQLGISVTPFDKNEKKPIYEDWLERHSTNSFVIGLWFEDFDRNIAMVTGQASGNIVVIDINEGSKTGIISLDKFEDRFGKLNSGPIVSTPSGGIHLYYRSKSPLVSKKGFLPGMDLLADGSCAILPPSIFGENNYSFLPLSDIDQAIPDLPDELLAVINGEDEAMNSLNENLTSGFENLTLSNKADADVLAEYGKSLLKKGYLKDDVRACLKNKVLMEGLNVVDSDIRAMVDAGTESDAGLDFLEIGRLMRDLECYKTIPGNVTYSYQKNVWKVMAESRFLQKEALSLLIKYGQKTDPAQIDKVVELMKIESYQEDQKNDSNYINLKNGLFDLETRTLIPHTPRIFTTCKMPVSYREQEIIDKFAEDQLHPMPVFDKFMREITCGDKQIANIISEMMGYCLCRHTKYERTFFLYGEGFNGKSTVQNLIRAMVGEGNYSALNLSDMNKAFNRYQLLNKLVNLSGEIDASELATTEFIKKIASGDLIQAENKFEPSFTFQPFVKLIFNGNNLPKVNDRSNGYFRKISIIPFNATLDHKTKDVNLIDKMREELDSIFIWALNGYRRLVVKGDFSSSESVDKALEAYQNENSSVRAFAAEMCVTGMTFSVPKPDLITAYNEWCKLNNHRPVSSNNFGRELTKIGVDTSERGSHRKYLGIRLLSSMDI